MKDVLPENLILEVLSRLPVKTIIRFKCVCKRWRELVSDPYFVRLQVSRSPEALLIDKFRPWPGSLEWVDLDPVKSINLNFRAGKYPLGTLLEGSVNGLVCCSHRLVDFYIFNPVLEEYMNIPHKPRLENVLVLSCGFGVSVSGEYKVIRICGKRIRPEVFAVEIEVYTLGTGQWRVLGQIPYRFNFTEKVGPGVSVNSHVYWIVSNGRIYRFDLNTETFELLDLVPSPPKPGKSKKMLGVLKVRLSLVYWRSLGLEVWVMKEESWCKEVAIQENISPILQSQPLCLTDGLKGTSILVLNDQSSKVLVAYCLNTKTILNLNLNMQGHFYSIIKYRPSFVKLQEFESKESSCHVTRLQEYGKEFLAGH